MLNKCEYMWTVWCYFTIFYCGALGSHKTNGVKKFPGTHQINYYLIDSNLSMKSDYALSENCCKVSQREKLTSGDWQHANSWGPRYCSEKQPIKVSEYNLKVIFKYASTLYLKAIYVYRYIYVYMCVFVCTRSVQKVSSHVIWKIGKFIEEDTKYKKHCT